MIIFILFAYTNLACKSVLKAVLSNDDIFLINFTSFLLHKKARIATRTFLLDTIY